MLSLLIATALTGDVKIDITRTRDRCCYTCVRHLTIERDPCHRVYLRTHEHIAKGMVPEQPKAAPNEVAPVPAPVPAPAPMN